MSVMILNPKQRTRAVRQPLHALRDSATRTGKLPIGCAVLIAAAVSAFAWTMIVLLADLIGGVL